jgi:Zn-dependent protease
MGIGRSDNFHLVPASSRASTWERIARVVFGVVVVPFFTGLSLILVQARSSMGEVPPKNAPPDIVLIAVILFLGLIAAYGLDQLLAGIQPARRRWFTKAEERLGDSLDQNRGRGSVTLGYIWGAPVRVHWSMIVGLVLVGGLQPGAWLGFLIVIIAHELGHAVLVRFFGQRVVGLSFHALGGECYWTGQPKSWQRGLIAWGGVAGQSVVACVAWGVARLLPFVFTGWFGDALGRAVVDSNLAMAAFNLLPIPPLDGAEAWPLLMPRIQKSVSASPSDAVSKVVEDALGRARRRPE